MKLQATYVSADEFDGQYFQISFNTEGPEADLDLSAPFKPYLMAQTGPDEEVGHLVRGPLPLPIDDHVA
jgi:hypothetical protein